MGNDVGVLLEADWDVGRGTVHGSVQASSPSSGVLGFLTGAGIGMKSCSSSWGGGEGVDPFGVVMS